MLALEEPGEATPISATPSWERLRRQLSRQLEDSGKWAHWADGDKQISWPASLEKATRWWREVDAVESCLLVAVLTQRGSRRGGDDDDAALAVVVLLEQGIKRMARELEDVCEVDDVRAAVWEEVKKAEPQLACKAPRFLIKRAKQRLVRSAAGLFSRKGGTVSLDALLDADSAIGRAASTEDGLDSRREFRDLLDWARASGVLGQDETQFLVELTVVAASVPEGAVANELSVRRGVSPRTIRRQKAMAVERLQQAVPAYLAATA